jgi:hypothetical protein
MDNLNLKFNQLVVGMLYENGQLSFTRFITLLFILLFVGVTIYLVATGKTWSHYSEFSTMTAGGGAVTQIMNKFVNSKYNSPNEQPIDKTTPVTSHPDNE